MNIYRETLALGAAAWCVLCCATALATDPADGRFFLSSIGIVDGPSHSAPTTLKFIPSEVV